MEELLTPVSQTYRKSSQQDELFQLSKPVERAPETEPQFRGSSPEEALQTLKNQPSYEVLLSVLKYLQKGSQASHEFDIRKPSPQSAQIVHILVTEIVPNYWTVLRDASSGPSKGDADVLLTCLRSLTGINAILAHMRALLKEAKSDSKSLKDSHVTFSLTFVLEMLSQLLHTDNNMKRIWRSTTFSTNEHQTRPMRQEFIALFASGKIVSLSSEAEDICRQAGKLKDNMWISDAKSYIDWLGRNMVRWMRSVINDDDLKLCAKVSARAIRLGNSGKSSALSKRHTY